MPNCMVCALMGMRAEGALQKGMYRPREKATAREVDVHLCQAHMGMRMEFNACSDKKSAAYVYFPTRQDQGCLCVRFNHTGNRTDYIMSSVEYGYDGCGWFTVMDDFAKLPRNKWVTFVDGKRIDIQGRCPPDTAALLHIIQSNP